MERKDGVMLINSLRMFSICVCRLTLVVVRSSDSHGTAQGKCEDQKEQKAMSLQDEAYHDCNGHCAKPISSAVLAKSQQKKRTDYLSWDDYFMSVAYLSALRSKDPSTQVGACIVNPLNRIVGIGYNGFPGGGCDDDDFPWQRDSSDELENKYVYVCHAEMNAIMNANAANAHGCSILLSCFHAMNAQK